MRGDTTRSKFGNYAGAGLAILRAFRASYRGLDRDAPRVAVAYSGVAETHTRCAVGTYTAIELGILVHGGAQMTAFGWGRRPSGTLALSPAVCGQLSGMLGRMRMGWQSWPMIRAL